jgi:phosphate transport system protein
MESRAKYNAAMDELYQKIMKMGSLVEEALKKALQALISRDNNLAFSVIENDSQIDNLQTEIENACTILIATEQPVAYDLRQIITIIKVAADLERIGDHARHLARALEKLEEAFLEKILNRLEEMTNLGIGMVHEALTSLSEQDTAKAKAVALKDSEVDKLHDTLFTEIIQIMEKDTKLVENGMHALFLNRFMERLGDHVTNICNWIVYAKEGSHIELNI